MTISIPVKIKKISASVMSVAALSLAPGANVYAESLQSILHYALTSDPVLKEAQAAYQSAQHRTSQAEALHLPVVTATGDQPIVQQYKYENDRRSRQFDPGVRVDMNLYTFGAIDAEVNKNKQNERYFFFKYDETREELASAITDLYLNALQSKQAIAILKNSLKRHNAIVKSIRTIAVNDEGRESEFVQAQARKMMVEQQINTEQRNLANMLSRLSSYSMQPVSAARLTDPFAKIDEKTLLAKYTLEDQTQNPTYLAQQAELESKKADIEAEKRKTYPSINLVGTANRHNRGVGINVSWQLFNRPSSYSVREKASEMEAASERLRQVARSIEESTQLAKINLRQNKIALSTLKRQIASSKKVVEFYKLQFQIARKTLIELLNAEGELTNVEMAYNTTKNALRHAVLDYLRSQGMLSQWSGILSQQQSINK